ncbi:transcriptional regulator [Thermococcus chitonophagus]|uniref:Archaeal heat shock regulator, ArsR family n=1 Tax=Thermococcus chitonophagus TaxID=54262 RepID=A0A160VQE2_9EURY|nr:helix-turn-helix domain-containing protein [Thermococcus chitonophagus]ASJ15854.1 transcriptional regulator [Thermococcus chitonophagus]CUX77093.1 Archaeal heat shock regulator, ArsR family [Thermococcus chitonophagus]
MEPDVFYILGNKVRRDLLSHLTCTECYFSLLSSRVTVSSTAVAKHLKIMEREGILQSYEKEERFIGPTKKYYRISIAKSYVLTLTPDMFWYKGFDLDGAELKDVHVNLSSLKEDPQGLNEMLSEFLKANRELGKVLEAFRAVEAYRNKLIKMIKEEYLKTIGDMTQLAILHYLLLNGEATIEELSDRLNLKEREVREKIEEMSRFIPVKMINDGRVLLDEAKIIEGGSDGEENPGKGK